jgi:putative endonuclease
MGRALSLSTELSTTSSATGRTPPQCGQDETMAYTYILRCSDGSFYVGSARNLDERMEQHARGTVDSYTASRRPVELVWYEEFDRIDDAFVVERKIKGWRRDKKQALIDGRFGDLPALSANRQS